MVRQGCTGKAAGRLFALLFAWLAAYEVRIVLFPGLDAGPLVHRGAHDVALLLSAGLCLWAASGAARSGCPGC